MSANYPVQVYKKDDWVGPFAQTIYAKCREICGPGSDPRKITIFSPGPTIKPYVTYIYIEDVGSVPVKTSTDLITATNVFDFASYWLTQKQAALLSESYNQEEADYIS